MRELLIRGSPAKKDVLRQSQLLGGMQGTRGEGADLEGTSWGQRRD